jgi:hypothetical protein
LRGLADAANGSIQAGAVAARSHDSDALNFCHCAATFETANGACVEKKF